MKVGDIYTNGINYWMISYLPKSGCEHCGAGAEIFGGPKCIPVMVKDKQIYAIETYDTLNLMEIKPSVVIAADVSFDWHID